MWNISESRSSSENLNQISGVIMQLPAKSFHGTLSCKLKGEPQNPAKEKLKPRKIAGARFYIEIMTTTCQLREHCLKQSKTGGR